MLHTVCMEYGLLVIIACVVGGGVAGGVLVSWGCHRRLLALEENLKVILLAYDDRLNQLSRIVVRQDKQEAAKVRWSGKAEKDEATLKALTNLSANGGATPAGHPWDPRTWGAEK